MFPEIILGLSLLTPHSSLHKYNYETPGVYLTVPSLNLSLGTVKNSYGFRSNWIAYSTEQNLTPEIKLSLLAGIISGYNHKEVGPNVPKILPLLSPGLSYKNLRAQYIPGRRKDSQAISFSIEIPWKG